VLTGEIPKKSEEDMPGPVMIPIQSIDIGHNGTWYCRQVRPDIAEEELDTIATLLHGTRLTVADHASCEIVRNRKPTIGDSFQEIQRRINSESKSSLHVLSC
jgi:hypothetical protein